MPKKPRKGRAKYKIRGSAQPLAAKEASQHSQPLPVSSKQAPFDNALVLSDLKRALVIIGGLLMVLIVLSLLLR